jgi:hypothetical protein
MAMAMQRQADDLIKDYDSLKEIDQVIEKKIKEEIEKPEFRQAYVIPIKQNNGQEKDFCRFDGLLHLARLSSWNGCQTSLLQLPNKDNGNLVISHSVVYDWKWRAYEGLGDCDDANAGSNDMAKHKVRIAETRSVGRALRKMLKVDMVMFEELDMQQEVDKLATRLTTVASNKPTVASPPKSEQQTPPAKSQADNEVKSYVTRGQLDTIKQLIKIKGISRTECQKGLEAITRPKGQEDQVGSGKIKVGQCTQAEVERFIEWLRSLPDVSDDKQAKG